MQAALTQLAQLGRGTAQEALAVEPRDFDDERWS
jgi:hypothetical protein